MENASRLLFAKFAAGRALLDKLAPAGVEAGEATALAGRLAALELRYALTSAPLFVRAAGGEAARLAAQTEYARLLAAEDFAGEGDRIVEQGEAALRAAGVPLRSGDVADAAPRRGRAAPGRGAASRGRASSRGPGRPGAPARPKPPADLCAEIQRLADVYPRADRSRGAGPGPAEGGPQQVDFERCPACGGPTAVDASRSELRCVDCGALSELVGAVFDDSQFYSQEGQKAKSGTFNPNRHFQFWWIHILAREPEEELDDRSDPDGQTGEQLLDALRQIIARDRMVLQLLLVTDVREMLREVDRSDLNKNVPLIMRKLTGVGPPQVSDAIAARAENLFTKAIEAGELVQRHDRVNRNYYPYYIGKIIDQIVPESDVETRRLLYYIYFQGKDTVDADDEDWEQICALVPELVYKPTDRFLGQKYHTL